MSYLIDTINFVGPNNYMTIGETNIGSEYLIPKSLPRDILTNCTFFVVSRSLLGTYAEHEIIVNYFHPNL